MEKELMELDAAFNEMFAHLNKIFTDYRRDMLNNPDDFQDFTKEEFIQFYIESF